MTTPSTPRKAGPLLGTGAQTSWPFTFKVFAASDIAVTIANNLGVETALVLNADYSVTLNANQETSPGGTVTYPISGSALPTGSKLTIFGNLPYDQPLDLPSGGNFSPLALENQLDRLTMQIQQLRELASRSLQLPVTSAPTNVQLPQPAASNIIGWNENGDNLENYPLSALATSLAFATYRYDTFTGNGSTTQFTLSADPVTLGNLDVAVGGVTQTPGADYLLVAGVIEFTSAPPLGATILARFGEGIASGPASDSYDVRFRQAGTGSVDRTAEAKMRETVSVKDFGAVGDGVTDDTAAIQAAIDVADKINFPAGHFIITAPLVLPPQKELVGVGGTGKVNWQSNFADLAGQTVINKTTNTPDAQFGLDALLICSNGSPSPVAAETGSQVYPAGGDVILRNLCFIGNGVHGPGGSGSHNAYGIVAGSGQHTHISNVFMRRTGVSLYMHGTYLSSVDHFDTFGQIYQYTGTSTTYTGCEAGYGLYGGFRLSSVSYSTLQNCAVDAPLYSAYTLKDCKGVSLVSCGQEFIREDPLPPSTRGMYLNFEGGNSVSVIAHRAFDNGPLISNPGYETSLISATTDDNISFVSDYIIIPLFPTITGLKYARLSNNARVAVSSGFGYLSDTFSGNFNIASTARYTIFDADAALVQMKGQLPSTQLPNTNGRGTLWAVDSYQADTALAVTIGGSSTGITYAWRKCSITRVNNKILVSMLIYMTATGGLTGTVKITGFPWELPATYYSRAFTFVLFNPATGTPRIAYGVVGAGGVIDLFDSAGVALTQAIFPPAPIFTQFDAQFIIEIDPATGP